MDIAFGNLFAVLQLEEHYQENVSHSLFFWFALHTTQQSQYETGDRTTFKFCSSFFNWFYCA